MLCAAVYVWHDRRDIGATYAPATGGGGLGVRVRSSVRDVDTPVGTARVHLARPDGALGALVLGHGAGGGIEAPDLVALTSLTADDWLVARVEQPWRVGGRRIAPPPPQPGTPPLAGLPPPAARPAGPRRGGGPPRAAPGRGAPCGPAGGGRAQRRGPGGLPPRRSGRSHRRARTVLPPAPARTTGEVPCGRGTARAGRRPAPGR